MPLAGQRLTPSVLTVGLTYGATPASTAANGTATSGTTETFDAVLGYYQATLIAGHRYQAMVLGLLGNLSVASDIFTIQIRDSQSDSNPTAASTMVAQTQWTSSTTATASRVPIALANTFLCTVSGVHTFGMSAVRTVGTGVFTPVTAFLRELLVADMGGN